jgi:hypothetical protein
MIPYAYWHIYVRANAGQWTGQHETWITGFQYNLWDKQQHVGHFNGP